MSGVATTRSRHPLLRRIGSTIALAVLALTASAHVGSPDAIWEGNAGAYPIRVIIRAPGVVPGRADIIVRTKADGITRITASPHIWNAGNAGAPPPDVLAPVPGDAHLYSVKIWFMRAGAYGVHVTVEGTRGTGTAIVPFGAAATRVLPLPPALGALLTALGIFLIVGMVTIVGAAVRESELPPGTEPDRRRIVRARFAMVATAVVLAVVATGAKAWWDLEKDAYTKSMLRPVPTTATLFSRDSAQWLRIAIVDSLWTSRQSTPLLPDHGKLMHAFLMRDDGAAGFAHLHPISRDTTTFEAALPSALPAGRYRLFADIVHESGFSETLAASIDIPANASPYAPSDADDAWGIAAATSDTIAMLGDGSTMIWTRTPIVAGQESSLAFRVAGTGDTTVEPYLGMAGHAVVERDDGSVFVHLHPSGTASMVAERALSERVAGDTVRGTLGARLTSQDASMSGMSGHAAMALPGNVSFPYIFPTGGTYRVWVQVRHGGQVRTASFIVKVADAAAA